MTDWPHALNCHELSRRAFIAATARSVLGATAVLGLPSTSHGQGRAAATTKTRGGRAKQVIYLFMAGGMSHIDTFDPKPGTRVQGPLNAIPTAVDGIHISEHWPSLAKRMQRVALVRSLTSNQGVHEPGQYYMHTSYAPRGTIKHPSIGAWASRLLSRAHPTLPGHVAIGAGPNMASRGFFDASLTPLGIGDPAEGLPDAHRVSGVTDSQWEHRLELLQKANRSFREAHAVEAVRDHARVYDEAMRLMESKDLDAFDLSSEPEKVRARYGPDSFAQGCLLARRLVERGVRFVEVVREGWDTHANNFGRLKGLSPGVDATLATLLDDLASRGLLDETLVVLTTEFGRSPHIVESRQAGRDHHPAAFSSLLVGGGIRGGQCVGATDEEARKVVERPVSVPDFNATIAHAMGLPLDTTLLAANGRPFRVAAHGEPVAELF